MTKEPFEFDEGRIAQMSATFAITIFLSLTLLFAEENPGYQFLEKLLWTASGFFCAASIRLIDRLFDYGKEFKEILSLVQWRGRSLFSLDDRWKNGRFTLYFLGWSFFFAAFVCVGLMMFAKSMPQNVGQFVWLLWEEIWFGCVVVVMFWNAVLSVTRQFVFIN